ncbi:50S ribosomal protein L25/general stress protein Ctc [Rhodocyclus tenuis]|uniref:Large ribosomal subunit protein bL25 n=2 Tax=Rhodocyclus TaxID=1064 RepID=A0A6L5JYB8_RHOTE|nr:50S ribosomal protein L25/general stress protein Ctc [Rhodocyclus gracilis]MQY52219.1 50S ribosomal protein L25/general stress protein Ctc [Rhodocyclus gracilis]MRD72351.1 50S ribosomal protein L25/general stress protein Ctc [Rhodocyclus gracilis]NJA89563.1 50S ribosomal protein L25/general stress protein Ctc [Rhodocyclus gracilis]
MKFELNAQVRTVRGSGASRRLRRAEKVPAVVYGGSAPAVAIELDHNQILLALRKEAFHSSVLTLVIDGVAEPVLLRDSQVHAYKPRVLHVDFLRIDATHEIHQKVPLHFVNADQAPGVKLAGGSVSHVLSEVEVVCLPKDLPEFIEVDLKDLAAGHSIHVSQLVLPAGVRVLTHGDDGVVALIQLKKGGAAAAEEGEAAGEQAAPAA